MAFGLKCFFTTVGFIDNELVGANPGTDDLTIVHCPCYNVRVSNTHWHVFCRLNPSVKAR